MTSDRTRVFVVDDHPIVRAGLREILGASASLTVVGEAESGGTSTVEAICSAETDVAILDIKLKRGSGIALCRALKERRPHIGVILLSAFWDDHLVSEALDARADGYLLKDAERFDLAKSIATVASGQTFFDPAISGTIARYARGDIDATRFSNDELQILRLASEGMTNKAIAAALSLSHHTVRDKLSRLLVALGAKNRAEAAQIAMRRGLI